MQLQQLPQLPVFEGAGHELLQARHGGAIRRKLARIRHHIARIAQHQRVVAVGLNQVEEVADVAATQRGIKKQVGAAVLQHVAPIAIAF